MAQSGYKNQINQHILKAAEEFFFDRDKYWLIRQHQPKIELVGEKGRISRFELENISELRLEVLQTFNKSC